MAEPWILCWFIVALQTLLTMRTSATITVDQFCSNEVAGKVKYSVNDGLQDYFRQCSNIDTYVDCILNARKGKTYPEVIIEPYEKVFPSDYDMRRAGFLFCSNELDKTMAAIGDDNMGACQDKIDFQKCKKEFVLDYKSAAIESALKSEDFTMAQNLSCEIMAPYKYCIKQQYITKCGKKYEGLMNYELAKLGGECLVAHDLHSPLVTLLVCTQRGKGALTVAIPTKGEKCIFVFIVVLSLVISEFF